MKIEFVDEAKNDLKDLTDKQLKIIKNKIQDLKNNPIGHEDSKLIQIQGRSIYRLEIKNKRGGEIDHRAIYDIESNKIRIYSIIYRESGYPDERIAERF